MIVPKANGERTAGKSPRSRVDGRSNAIIRYLSHPSHRKMHNSAVPPQAVVSLEGAAVLPLNWIDI